MPEPGSREWAGGRGAQWEREQFLISEEKRIHGDEVNAADHYGLDVSVVPDLHPGKQAKNYHKRQHVTSNKYSTSRFASKRDKALSNNSWVSERLKKQLKEYPSLWNSSVPFNESMIHQLYAPDGALANLTEGERLMKLYDHITAETKLHTNNANRRINEIQETLERHRNALVNETKHPEIVSHRTRKSMGWFNQTSGRVVLGVTNEISDDENVDDDESSFQT